MKNITISLLCATIATFAIASSVSAATTTCQPIYGGGQTCVQSGNVVINKEVQFPGTNGYVDNLFENNPKHMVGKTFNFRITVSNTGGENIAKVTVKDFLPKEVSFVAGPGNVKDGVFTADILNLAPNTSQSLTITVKANDLAANEAQKCEIRNKAVAIVDGQVEDEARFCIAKVTVSQVPSTTKGGLKVFPPAQVKTTPPTGPEMIALAGLFPTGVLGYFLRKRAL